MDLSQVDWNNLNIEKNNFKEVSDRDIAVVGMAVKFPKANNVDEFWNNLKSGIDCTSEIPTNRKKDTDDYLNVLGIMNNKIKYQKTGYLNEIDKFDYNFFKISPKEAALMDPNQRIFLETALSAIEDAGYGGSKIKGTTTGVYVGFSATEMYDYKRMILEAKPEADPIAIPGNIVPIIAGRVSYFLDLDGPSMTVDTACSSSLVAFHLACQGVKSGDCDMAIVGGVKINMLPIEKEEKLGIESQDGITRPFDHDADGTVISEGSAAIIIKPLNKAVLDGDNIYAVVKASAVNQDGKSVGITAPNAKAQRNVILKAWKDAQVDPLNISYIEAHGTGTKIGDPIEIDGIEKAFKKFTNKKQFCAIGSVKGNLGHLDCVAGLAGLIKTTLALYYGEIPPSIHFSRPNKKIKMHKTAVYLNNKIRKWETGNRPKQGGVSSFGLSGTNCHVVLEEWPVRAIDKENENKDFRLLTISAKSQKSLKSLIRSYKEYIESHKGLNIDDISYTLNTGRAHNNYRLAFIVKDLKDFEMKMNLLLCLHTLEDANQLEDVYYGYITESDLSEHGDKLKILQKNNKQQLKDLCDEYIKGNAIKWESLYEKEKRKIVRFPTYVFERNRCWLELKQIVEKKESEVREHIFFRPNFKRSDLQREGNKTFTGKTIVLKDKCGLADQLIKKLIDASNEVIEIAFGDSFHKIDENKYEITGKEEEYTEIFKDFDLDKVSQIIHLSSITNQYDMSSLQELNAQMNMGVNSLRYLIRVLKKNVGDLKCDITLVSDYANGVVEHQKYVKPVNASLFGMGKVIIMENQMTSCRCIDIDADTKVETIIQEIFSSNHQFLSAYRNDVRYIEEIAEIDLKTYKKNTCQIKKGGVYIIAGGTGAIGLEMAKYLANQEKVNLILVNRSMLPDKNTWNQCVNTPVYQKISSIMEIEEMGSRVVCYPADISKEEDVNNLIAYVMSEFKSIDGIINSAGIGINTESMNHNQEEDFESVVAPKIQGTWLLDKATEDISLDFFVVFSSVITLIGGVGVAAYTSGNTYLDAFTEYRNKKGKQTLTINWAMWEQTFDQYVADADKDTEKYKNRQIFDILPKQTAINAFDSILKRCIKRVIVGQLNLSSEIFLLQTKLPFAFSDEMKEKIRLAGKESWDLRDNVDVNIVLHGRDDNDYTDRERAVAKIFCKVLGYNEINLNDNFYELGGDSILIMRVINQIAESIGVEISLTNFIENSTVSRLSSFIDTTLEIGKEDTNTTKVIYPKYKQDLANANNQFPLTQVQMAYLMGRNEQFELGGISTHIYTEVEMYLDIHKFTVSLNKIIKKHPMLRAIIHTDGTQKILSTVPEYKLQIKDLTNVLKEERQEHILVERERMSHYIFKTDQYPLYEFTAFKLDNHIYYLCIGFDVLIADGASLNIIMNDIIEDYIDSSEEIDKLDFTFRDYVLAYKDFEHSDTYERDKNYWLSKLEDFPQPPLIPLMQNPLAIKKPNFRRIGKVIEKEKWDLIKNFAGKNNISPSALLATAYTSVLSFWSGQPKLAINLTLFNRYPFHKDVDKIVGDFTSIMLLEIDYHLKKSFLEHAHSVQSVMMEALEHRHYDGIEFIRDISRYNRLGTKAAMPYVFTSMLFSDKGYSTKSHDKYYTVKYRITQTPQVYLDHQVSEYNGALELYWDYVVGLFDDDMIEAMFDQYTSLLMNLIEDQDNCFLCIPENDKNLIARYNATEEEACEETLTSLFIRQAIRTPNHIAVELEDERITYETLNRKSDMVAHYLKARGVIRGDYVCVVGNRLISTIVNILGIIKTGAAYVPIDPDYPDERKNYIVKTTHSKVVLDSASLDEVMRTFETGQGPIDDSRYKDTAYVIFTSGSTGTPKGVVISHEAAVNTITDINRRFLVTDKDKVIGISSMCFDLSVYDIFGALSVGATLVQVKDRRDLTELILNLNKKDITLWNSVPAVMEMMIDNLTEDFVNYKLSRVLLSGDFIPVSLPDKIKKHFPNAKVISLGGATEAAIWSIYYPIDHVKAEWTSIPYGMPLSNQTLYILNYDGQISPINVPGEICIGGKGLANGYFKDEEKTNAAFFYHPEFGRLYKTGDYGIFLKQGYIEILGRKDKQVKIKGYRIELGEIESVIFQYPEIKNVVVIDRLDSNGMKYLCAYITLEKDVDVKELKTYLATKLPEYMIPQHITVMDEFTLNSNGKIDRKNLPEPEKNYYTSEDYIEPSNEVEEELVRIWSEILNVDRIGVEDNFFDLGGDSFYLVKMHKLIEDVYPNKISITDIFANPTIAMLTRHIMGDTTEQKDDTMNSKEATDSYEEQISNMLDQVREGTLNIEEAIDSILSS